MDEYLEFHPKVQEALREPLEKGKIRLVRRGLNVEFPAHFLLTATTKSLSLWGLCAGAACKMFLLFETMSVSSGSSEWPHAGSL